MATKGWDDPMQGGCEILVAETADTELTYSSGSADTSFIQTARCHLPYGKLKHTGSYRFVCAGTLAQPASTQTYEVQLVIDGAAVSPVMSFTNAAGFFAGTGTFLLEVEVFPVAFTVANVERAQIIKGELTITDGTNQTFNGKACTFVSVDTQTAAGHTMGLQVRKSVATANHILNLQSQNCYHFGGMSGS